jgi:RNA polymerase sigma-70 factor, ECF subfamily
MDVLQRFAAGDLDAFESLFRQHQRDVYRWIVRIVRDTAAAEDLTMETFWRMHRSHARFDPARNFSAWMRRIATNVALDHLRRVRPTGPLPTDPADPRQDSHSQSDSVVRKETCAAIAKALAELSPRLRVVIQLALIEDESYPTIAEALGISPSAVKLRMFRGVRLLRKKLEQRGIKP